MDSSDIDLNIVIAGAAGEGIQTIGSVLGETLAAQGYAVFSWKEYESRIRGGHSSFSIRVGTGPRNAPRTEADIILAVNAKAAERYAPILKDGGVLLGPESGGDNTITLAFADMAEDLLGDRIYANTIAVGALTATVGLKLEPLKEILSARFKDKGEEIIKGNHQAAAKGYAVAREECQDRCPWQLPTRNDRYYLIGANEAISLASAYAGCRFIAAYPMTPSTGVITNLANRQPQLGVFTEQAEDELAAINMAIGAAYGGARAMTATSGGGFALMAEGISLAGMTETPVVIVLAQRPGPATGLPTRTAQGDLLFAINAGHGEFPKMVLAPSDPKEAFHSVVRAFNLADRYQTPVILLTDQLMADARFSFSDLEAGLTGPEFAPADPAQVSAYRRYQVTESGISPRLYPGQSKHLVGADSDEHDERGHITEDLPNTALAMAEKRRRKYQSLQGEIHPPEETNLDDAEIVFVSWGSSRNAVSEAVDSLRQDGTRVGMIHFTDLWPLPPYSFSEEKSYWSVEGNASGQLARLLRSEYGLSFDRHLGRYDGLPLTATYIRSYFNER